MTRFVVALLFPAILCMGFSVSAQSDMGARMETELDARAGLRLGLPALGNNRDPIADVLGNYFHRQAFGDSLTGPFSLRADYLWGFERYRVSRFESTLQGADLGITLGLFMGAVGGMAGLWDENTSWWVAGGMAVLGAIWGGTEGAKNPRWRVRARPTNAYVPDSN